jgi:magnesium transporter
MLSRYEHGGITWVDLESPTRPEVQRVIEEFHLSHFVGEELLLPTTKPRVEVYSDHLYMILHFPALRHSHKTLEQEIDFVVGRNYLITTRYDTIDPLHKFSKVFEVDSVLDHEMKDDHAGYLFFSMLRRLYRSVENELDFVRSDMAHIEKHIFSGHELEMVKQISRSARDLLNLRQTIEQHRDVLREMHAASVSFFGDSYASFSRAIENDYYRLHNHIMRNIESLHELRETNNSLLSTKENETMRVLTIMALLTFPLALLVAIVDINTEYNPIIGLPYDFWIVVGIVAFIGTGMLSYFKHKHWL